MSDSEAAYGVRTNRTEKEKQLGAENRERADSKYRDLCSKGPAVARLSNLSFDGGFNRLLDDGQNTTRLEKILKGQGCLRLNKQYHVPVLIDSADWDSKTTLGESALASSLQLPELQIMDGYSLRALDHESLIAAARAKFEKMQIEDPWWVVDIYVTAENSDISLRNELIRNLQESFQNEQCPPDGRIYRSIRFYQGFFTGVRNLAAEDYWWAVLEAKPGSRKGRHLRALSKGFRKAFDALLPIPGLWAGMNLGVLHKLKAMRCDEPIICYLEHIRRTFFRLVDYDIELVKQIDANTVKLIRSRAPKLSTGDMEDLEREMENNKLFPYLQDHERDMIWGRLQNIDYPIPTLETFFQDILYLDVCQSVIRQLCLRPPTGRNTIDTVLKTQHNGFTEGLMSRSYWEQTIVNPQVLDLWRMSFQFAFELSSKRDHFRRLPRKDRDKIRASTIGPDERLSTTDKLRLRSHFFSLARSYGFDVPLFEPEQMPNGQLPRTTPCDFPPGDEDIEIERRSGKPFTDSIYADRYALSRHSLRHTVPQRISAGFVRQSVFWAFFSYLGLEFDDGFPEDLIGMPAQNNDMITINGEDEFPANGSLHANDDSFLDLFMIDGYTGFG